jgi:hypothetical protein
MTSMLSSPVCAGRQGLGYMHKMQCRSADLALHCRLRGNLRLAARLSAEVDLFSNALSVVPYVILKGQFDFVQDPQDVGQHSGINGSQVDIVNIQGTERVRPLVPRFFLTSFCYSHHKSQGRCLVSR